MTRNRLLLGAALCAAIFAGGFTSFTPEAKAIVAAPNQGWNATTIGEWNKFWVDLTNLYFTVGNQYGWGNANTLWTKAYNNGLGIWKATNYAYVNGWPLAFWDGFVAYVKHAGLTGPSLTAFNKAYNDYILWHLSFAPAGYPTP